MNLKTINNHFTCKKQTSKGDSESNFCFVTKTQHFQCEGLTKLKRIDHWIWKKQEEYNLLAGLWQTAISVSLTHGLSHSGTHSRESYIHNLHQRKETHDYCAPCPLPHSPHAYNNIRYNCSYQIYKLLMTRVL